MNGTFSPNFAVMDTVSDAVERLELDLSESNRGGDGQRVQAEHGPRAPGQTLNISYLQVFGLRRAATLAWGCVPGAAAASGSAPSSSSTPAHYAPSFATITLGRPHHSSELTTH